MYLDHLVTHEKLALLFSQRIISPQLTSPHIQYLGSSGSTMSSATCSFFCDAASLFLGSAFLAFGFSVAGLSALLSFLGGLSRLPIVTAAPPSLDFRTVPGAGRLLRRDAAVMVGAGLVGVAGVADLRLGRSWGIVAEDGAVEVRRDGPRGGGVSCFSAFFGDAGPRRVSETRRGREEVAVALGVVADALVLSGAGMEGGEVDLGC